MPRLGDLERAVMEVLWAASGPLTAKAVCDALDDRSLAVTTVLTVLSRLERKALVTRRRDERAHSYVAAASRADHVAQLMREALGTAGDRDAALARFVGAASPQEVDVLRRALRSLRARTTGRAPATGTKGVGTTGSGATGSGTAASGTTGSDARGSDARGSGTKGGGTTARGER